MALNDRQRVFARLLVQGVPQAEAYRRAFDCSGRSVATVCSNACRLAKNADVLRLVAQLRREADGCAVLDRQRRLELLSSKALDCYEAGEVADMVRCIAELNRMDGAYVPERKEVQVLGCFAAIMGELGKNGGAL